MSREGRLYLQIRSTIQIILYKIISKIYIFLLLHYQGGGSIFTNKKYSSDCIIENNK